MSAANSASSRKRAMPRSPAPNALPHGSDRPGARRGDVVVVVLRGGRAGVVGQDPNPGADWDVGQLGDASRPHGEDSVFLAGIGHQQVVEQDAVEVRNQTIAL